MKRQLAGLLLASCLALAGLLVSAALLLRDQRRRSQRNGRIDAIAHAYRASQSEVTGGASGLGLALQGATLASRVARLLRYDPAHREIYAAPPLAVLVLALVPSVPLAYVVVGFTGQIGWVAAPAVCMLLCRGFYGWFEERLVATLFRQFPDALAMIVRAVRVGLPMVEAIRVVARENPEPTAREFAALVAQTAIGVPLEDALREMAERNRLPEYRFFATALSLQSQTGGGLTETLENLADTIRKRVAAKLRGHALAAEARMSSYILGALPLVAGVVLSAINPGYMAVLFTDPNGRTLLLVAGGMLLTGAFIMRTMIRKSLT
jgi:tight adherence protein B